VPVQVHHEARVLGQIAGQAALGRLAGGAPLEDSKTYKIVVNNFMATGGDNYDTLAKGRNVVDTGILIRGVLEDYVTARTKRNQSVDVKLDGRIERLGTTTPVREDR